VVIERQVKQMSKEVDISFFGNELVEIMEILKRNGPTQIVVQAALQEIYYQTLKTSNDNSLEDLLFWAVNTEKEFERYFFCYTAYLKATKTIPKISVYPLINNNGEWTLIVKLETGV